MDKILKLKSIIETVDPKIISPIGRRKKLVPLILEHHKYLAYFEYFVNNDMLKAKQAFYQFGLGDILHTEKLNSRSLSYGISRTSYILLSDSKELIERYGNLTFPGYEERVVKGELAIFSNTIQKFMIHDYAGVAKNISIMEERVVPKKSRKGEIPVYLFFKSLLEKDKDKVLEHINFFLIKKIHKKWMKHDALLSEFVAFPALGYTKLAWQQGLEIEIDSPFIPMELMPIQPNEYYIDAYPFLWNMDKKELLEFELDDDFVYFP